MGGHQRASTRERQKEITSLGGELREEAIMQAPLRILHLEDDAKDAELLLAMLEAAGIVFQVSRVDSQADFLASLEQGGCDLILADYSLPSFDGLSALKIALEKCPIAASSSPCANAKCPAMRAISPKRICIL